MFEYPSESSLVEQCQEEPEQFEAKESCSQSSPSPAPSSNLPLALGKSYESSSHSQSLNILIFHELFKIGLHLLNTFSLSNKGDFSICCIMNSSKLPKLNSSQFMLH